MSTKKPIANEMTMLTDAELMKDSEHPIGPNVHISTCTHAWRGTLKHVSPNYFVLVDAHMVGDTGDVAAYSRTGKGSEASDTCVGTIRIPRTSVAWILSA